eukprot:gene34484-42529_t
MAMDDDGCDEVASCSMLTFTVSGSTSICDNTFTVREACWSDDSCSGTISLYGVDTLLTTTPTVWPTLNPSRRPSVTPQIVSTNAPSASPWQATAKPPISKSLSPTGKSSELPRSTEPSMEPSEAPSAKPATSRPITLKPSAIPSRAPSLLPTPRPTTALPTTTAPSFRPTTLPTRTPTRTPTVRPSSRQPTTSQPSFASTHETRWIAAPSSPLTHWTRLCSDSSGLFFVAATESVGVYHSTDSGSTWLLSDAPSDCDWLSLSCSSDGAKVFAVCDGVGVYASVNFGMTWKLFGVNSRRRQLSVKSSPSALLSAMSVVHMAISGSGSTIFAVMSDGTIVRSLNSGSSWTEIVVNHASSEVYCTPSAQYVLALGQNDCVFWSSTSGSDWSVLSVDCVGFNTAAISDDGQYVSLAARDSDVCYYSANYGASFISFSTRAPYPFTTLIASSSGQFLAATSSG